MDKKGIYKKSEKLFLSVGVTAVFIISGPAQAMTSLSDPKPLQVAGLFQEINKVLGEIKGGTSATSSTSTTPSSTTNKTTAPATPPAPVLVAPAAPAPAPAVVESADVAHRAAIKKTDELISSCQKISTTPKNDDANSKEVTSLEKANKELDANISKSNQAIAANSAMLNAPNPFQPMLFMPGMPPDAAMKARYDDFEKQKQNAMALNNAEVSKLEKFKTTLKSNTDRLTFLKKNLAERAPLLKLCTPEKMQEIQMKRIEEAKTINVAPLPAAPAPGGVSSKVRQKATRP